jgi:formylglycine-generating enzyme required for sulfatase activity
MMSEAPRRVGASAVLCLLYLLGCGSATRAGSDGDADAAADAMIDSEPIPDAMNDVDEVADAESDVPLPPDGGDADWTGACPEGMTGISGMHFEGSYCMDQYEAHIAEDGRAVSSRLSMPSTPVTWAEAREACWLAGKELCRIEVWHDGCSTDAWSSYPYSGLYEPGRCNDSEAGFGAPWAFGEGCVSVSRTYDMVGNVSEWVDNCTGAGAERTCDRCGGSFLEGPEFANCNACVRADPTDATEGSGFRCCAPTRY